MRGNTTMGRAGVRALAALISVTAPAIGSTQQASDQALPRRAAIGVVLDQDASAGVIITEVLPGSAAARAGLEPGDEIREIDGVPVASVTAVQASIGQRHGGDLLGVEITRAGQPLALSARLDAFPFEQMDGSTVTYGHVTITDGLRLRTILSLPEDGAEVPAVMVLQGGSCGSVDIPWSTGVGIPGLVHAIASAGFATMRVDKPGTGDSEGPPCATIGYLEEVEGYRAAMEALLAQPRVDSSRVFLVGISLGGVFAPILADEYDVAGISVYGTPSGPPNPYPGRSDRFFEEFARVDVHSAWSRVATPVQLVRGTYDDRATRIGYDFLMRQINERSAGTAEHIELPRLDHCWTRHETFEASIDNCGGGESTTDLQDTVLGFLTALT